MCVTVSISVTACVTVRVTLFTYRTGNHFHGYAVFVRVFNGLLGVRARRVEECKHAKHLPLSFIIRFCNC